MFCRNGGRNWTYVFETIVFIAHIFEKWNILDEWPDHLNERNRNLATLLNTWFDRWKQAWSCHETQFWLQVWATQKVFIVVSVKLHIA